MEEWKTIEGFPNYQVSNFGNVKSIDRYVIRNNRSEYVKGKVLKQSIRGGYYFVAIYNGNRNNRKQIFVHRLVALAFIPNPYKLPCVNHKDENKFNNMVDNLEWCTHKYNSNYGTSISRRVNHQNFEDIAKQVRKPILQYDIDMNLVSEWSSASECERMTNGEFKNSGISKCCNGKLKQYKGFIWRHKHD